MSTGSVRQESRGALALLTIDAPPLNRIDAQMIAGLRAALDEVERAEGLRALVLRGAGDVFSAGADVSLFDGLGPDQAEALIGGFLELGDRIERLPFPTLAAAHGQCIAGGLELALFCDLLWCAEGTLIGLPEARLGIMPLAGGVQRLAARAGVGRARAMVFSGGIYPAERVEPWGVVDRVVAAGAWEAEVESFGAQLAAGPTRSFAAIKRVLLAERRASIGTADATLASEIAPIFASADAKAGIEAYLRGDLAGVSFVGA
jgi:enoyl-CoA hydratase/carnithine racemase